MNVYDIDGYYIAAENTAVAFGHYMEETDNLEDVYLEELEESEEEQIIINMKRLTRTRITAKNIQCCEDGCHFCEGKDDIVYVSLQDLMEKATVFPCIVAKED